METRRPFENVATRCWRALRHDPALWLGTAGVSVLLILALVGPVFWTASPTATNLAQTLSAPSLHHPMGTDDVGRDLFSRFNYGARTSLLVGTLAVMGGALIGSLLGLVSGGIGGSVDAVIGRVSDILLAFPPIILAVAITIGLGAGLVGATIGIILTSIPYYARVTKSEVIRVRSLAFIEAVRAAGASRRRVLFRHIMPNSVMTLPVLVSQNFGYAILTLAALGYIGLGIQPPTPEWGGMITEGQAYILGGQWWLVTFPGIGLIILTMSTGLLADSFHDRLDPRGAQRE
jgi:peptide/nickel transport system permease protein